MRRVKCELCGKEMWDGTLGVHGVLAHQIDSGELRGIEVDKERDGDHG